MGYDERVDTRTKTLQEVIAEVRKRRAAQPKPVPKPNWREAFGAVSDDELSREAAKLGAEWRAKENQRR